MKRKADLLTLVTELKDQMLEKKDFVIPSRFLSMVDGKIVVKTGKEQNNALNDMLKGSGISFTQEQQEVLQLQLLEIAHQQFCEKLGIPKTYFEKMLAGHIGLLDHNVSYWFTNAQKNFLLRTFINPKENKGVLRALLADRFLLLDNYDVLMTALEGIKESGIKIDIESCDLTDKRMYVRFIAPDIEIQAPELLKHYRVPGGSPNEGKTGIMTGFVLSNSEVGHGQFSISPRCVIHACTNGMIFKDDAFSRVHIGKRMDEYTNISWSEETKQKNLQLIMSQVKDAVKAFIRPEFIGSKIQELTLKGAKPLQHPTDTVKNICQELALSEDKENAILNYFVRGGDTNVFGAAQALTFFAHKDADADQQYEFEKLATEVVQDVKEYDKPHIASRSKKTNQLNMGLSNQ